MAAISAQGARMALALLVNKQKPSNLVLRLFVNLHTVSDNDTEKSFIEAAGHGYEPITMVGSKWEIDKDVTAIYPKQRFVFSGALGTVAGYFVTRTSGELIWAERFDSPIFIQNDGDELRITPRIKRR